MSEKSAKWVRLYEDGEPPVEQHQIGIFCSKCMHILKGCKYGPEVCPNCGRTIQQAKYPSEMQNATTGADA